MSAPPARELPFTALVLLDDEAAGRAGRVLDEQARRILDAQGAGRVALVVRRKDRPRTESATLARALRAPCTTRGALLLVHTFVDVARACGADGVHLAAAGSPISARRALDPDAIIGWSRHAGDALDDDEARATRYLTLSPFARPRSKPDDARAPLGAAGLTAAGGVARVPIVALGGLDADNVGHARRAGAAGFAVIDAVVGARAPDRALDALLAAWDRVADEPGVI